MPELQKEAEAARQTLAQGERLRALGQMASGIAHDLNQSLALITGYSESTMRELPDDLPLWRKPFASGELLNYIQRVLTAAPCSRA